MIHKWSVAVAAVVAVSVVSPAVAKQDVAEPVVGEIAINTFSGAFLAAQIAEFDNDTPSAIWYYQQALAYDPDNQMLQQNLMLALVSTGKFDPALPLARELKTVANVERYSRLILAVDSFRSDQFQDAENWLKFVLESDLDRLIGALMTAWAMYGQERVEDAIAHIDALEGPQWYDLFTTYHRALLSAMAGREAEATRYFDAALANRSGGAAAPDTYARSIEAYAGFLARIGKRDEAASLLSDSVEIVPGLPALTALQKRLAGDLAVKPIVESGAHGAAEVLLNLGTAINRSGAESFVRLYLQLARVLNPGNDILLMQLAALAEQQGKPEEAIALYESVPVGSAQSRVAQMQLGLNLADLDRTEESISHLKALIAQDPKDIRAYLSLGGVYSSEKDYAAAAELYERSIKALGPTDRNHWNIYYQRGIAYERLKQWEKAEPSFHQALELYPDQPQVLNYLGYSWIDMNMNLEEGLRMIRKAVELRPRDGYIVDSLGWAYYRLGRYEEAITELERAVSLRPEDAVINDHLGDAYWKGGRRLEATFQWNHARVMEPEPELVVEIDRKLKEGLSSDTMPMQQKSEEEKGAEAKPESARETAVQLIADTASQPSGEQSGSRYRVLPGQSLWSIATELLGRGNRYTDILELNPGLSNNPDLIYPGQELQLPEHN